MKHSIVASEQHEAAWPGLVVRVSLDRLTREDHLPHVIHADVALEHPLHGMSTESQFSAAHVAIFPRNRAGINGPVTVWGFG
jgi:hypothetical protein